MKQFFRVSVAEWLGALVALLLPVSTANAATLELQIVDEAQKPLPCRVLVVDTEGNCAIPKGEHTVTLKIGPHTWFISPGTSELEVSPGAHMIRVEHGHEFERHKSTIDVDELTESTTITLSRWVNMHDRGYLCGENHLHVDSASVGPMAIAEGLDFGTSLTWWNGPDARRPVPEGNGPTRILRFGNRQVIASIYDAELEYGWGAAYIQNLPSPLPSQGDSAQPNLDHLRHAVDAGAIVHYQGGWSREVGLDAILGYVHTVNVCNNNFHLHKFQPRSRYSNLLEIDGFPVYPNTEEGMLRMNTDTYYRLLNWGLQLSAGAGSATGAKETPPGYNRAYVRVKSGASLEAFYNAWKQGKNFVTNGPMLFLSTSDGKRPGDKIALEKEANLSVRVEAISATPLQRIDIIVNGEIAKSIPANDAKRVDRTIDVTIAKGSWIAARCIARDGFLSDEELAPYRRDANLNELPSRIRFAHTSPIYVTVNGKGARVQKSIAEGMKMLEALEQYGEEHCGEAYKSGFHSALQRARRILREGPSISANSHPNAAPGKTSLTNSAIRTKKNERGIFAVNRNRVEAVFVDNEARDFPVLPRHRAGYNGVGSLKRNGSDNLFVGAYAGLNFEHIHDGTSNGLAEKFEPRKFPMELRALEETTDTIELYQPPTGNWKLESCGRYEVLSDGTIEYSFECIPRAGNFRHDFIGLFWASYIDSPRNKSIYFIGRLRDEPGSKPRLIEGITPAHGIDSTHAPASAPDLPKIDADFPLTLVNHPSKYVHTEPWFYGVSHGMALVFMFRERDGIWFAQSPSGGGGGNPAWDFQWFIRNPKVGDAYGIVMRLACIRFESHEQIERATRDHRRTLNSE